MLSKNKNINFYPYIISWSLQKYQETLMKIPRYIYNVGNNSKNNRKNNNVYNEIALRKK